MRCLQAEALGRVGGHGDSPGKVGLCVPRRAWRPAGRVEGADGLGRRDGAHREGRRGAEGVWGRRLGEELGSSRGAPAFSPDQARLPEGPPGCRSREAGLQSLEGGGGPGGGWNGVWVVCGRPGVGPDGRMVCPLCWALSRAIDWGLPSKRPRSDPPTPTHWASWGPLTPAPQTLRESRPGQPGHSFQGTLINQTSLPNGQSPATGSGSPSVRSMGARHPVPQGDPSSSSPPRCSGTRPSAPLSVPAPGLDTDLCRGHTGPSGWQPFPSWTEK